MKQQLVFVFLDWVKNVDIFLLLETRSSNLHKFWNLSFISEKFILFRYNLISFGNLSNKNWYLLSILFVYIYIYSIPNWI